MHKVKLMLLISCICTCHLYAKVKKYEKPLVDIFILVSCDNAQGGNIPSVQPIQFHFSSQDKACIQI